MLEQFFYENFIQPLCHYYTPVETLTYGIILAASVLGLYKLLNKLKIKIDKRFFLALIPFIIYGGWTRALRDHNLGIYIGNIWCSPPIYFIIFLITFSILLISIFIEKKYKINYEKTMIAAGAALLLYNLSITKIVNFNPLIFVLSIIIPITIALFLVSKFYPKILSKINFLILSSHMLDGTASFTAINYFGYYEQHVLPGFLINLFGPWVMFPLKLIVVYFVLIAIDKYSEDEFFRNFLKIIVLILGLALGIRDTITMLL